MDMIYILLAPFIILLLILITLHIGFIPPRIRETKTPADFAMPYSEQKILTVKSKALFSWFIASEESECAPLIIIMHGWGSNAEHMLPVAATFYQAGMNVLLLDSRCHGQSSGDSYSALPRFAEDILHGLDYAQANLCFNGQVVLLGHSVGAAATLYAATQRDDISAVISISSFAHPQWLMQRYFQTFKLPEVLIQFLLGYIQWIIGHRFAEIAPLNSITKLQMPVLLVHGTHDTTVPLDDARAIQKNNPDVELLVIDGADHESVEMLETHGQLLVNFIKQQKLL